MTLTVYIISFLFVSWILSLFWNLVLPSFWSTAPHMHYWQMLILLGVINFIANTIRAIVQRKI